MCVSPRPLLFRRRCHTRVFLLPLHSFPFPRAQSPCTCVFHPTKRRVVFGLIELFWFSGRPSLSALEVFFCPRILRFVAPAPNLVPPTLFFYRPPHVSNFPCAPHVLFSRLIHPVDRSGSSLLCVGTPTPSYLRRASSPCPPL